MRYLTFRVDGQTRWGRADRNRVIPLDGFFPSLKAAIEAGAIATGELAKTPGSSFALSEIEHLPVLPDPAKILCVGLNYEEHRRETGRVQVAHPTIFIRFADSQVGHEAPIRRPRESAKLDYEGELAIVIGKPGRRIPASSASAHIAGYSCYNDASVRDWQAHTSQFTAGKNFPGTGAFGPCLVTPEEFGVPGPQRLETRLNGRIMQEATLAQMIFPIASIIEYCSSFTPLRCGDIILTGTPGGVGVKRDPQVFMSPGDQIEIEIEGIGVLRNSVVGDGLE
jgi:2-keto-4-pentenoate hydratase/2-oxohepta-3-ene-1,7-dioic acid hydratase in catechol pathway